MSLKDKKTATPIQFRMLDDIDAIIEKDGKCVYLESSQQLMSAVVDWLNQHLQYAESHELQAMLDAARFGEDS